MFIAGQERFRTLTSAYYRGAHGVIFVYDVTRRDTFQRLKDDWLNELDHYSTNADIVKMVVGNKIDLAPRTVSQGEGDTFSKQVGALFVESSAKTCTGVERAFEDLVRRILRTPSLCSGTTKDFIQMFLQRCVKFGHSYILSLWIFPQNGQLIPTASQFKQLETRTAPGVLASDKISKIFAVTRPTDAKSTCLVPFRSRR